MHLSKTIQFAILSLIFFLLGVAAIYLVTDMISDSGEELELRMEVVGSNKVIQDRYDNLQVILRESAAERTQLSDYLLTEGKTINFLSEIEGLARQLGVEVVTDSLTVNSLPNPDFQTVDLKLRASGGKASITRFISLLETLPYYSSLNSLSLSSERVSGGDWEASVVLMVGMHAYDR